MSDAPQGPGWWRATDGKWYPPEQHPAAVGWTLIEPPPERRRRGRAGVLIAAALVVVAVLVGVALVVAGGDDEATSAGPTSDTGGAGESELGQVFADPDEEFTIAVPVGWVGVSLRDDPEAAIETATSDARLRLALSRAVDVIPRGVVFLGIEADDLDDGFATNLSVLPIDEVPGSLDELEREAEAGLELAGLELQAMSRVEIAGTAVLRVAYQFPAGPLESAQGVQFYVVGDDTTWVLTFVSDDFAAHEAAFDASAATFQLS